MHIVDTRKYDEFQFFYSSMHKKGCINNHNNCQLQWFSLCKKTITSYLNCEFRNTYKVKLSYLPTLMYYILNNILNKWYLFISHMRVYQHGFKSTNIEGVTIKIIQRCINMTKIKIFTHASQNSKKSIDTAVYPFRCYTFCNNKLKTNLPGRRKQWKIWLPSPPSVGVARVSFSPQLVVLRAGSGHFHNSAAFGVSRGSGRGPVWAPCGDTRDSRVGGADNYRNWISSKTEVDWMGHDIESQTYNA